MVVDATREVLSQTVVGSVFWGGEEGEGEGSRGLHCRSAPVFNPYRTYIIVHTVLYPVHIHYALDSTSFLAFEHACVVLMRVSNTKNMHCGWHSESKFKLGIQFVVLLNVYDTRGAASK